MDSGAKLEDEGAWERAADALRSWALDESLKKWVMASPQLEPLARGIAARYAAGESAVDAVAAVELALQRGHLGSIEYAGESVRDGDLARAETAVILDLTSRIAERGLPSTVSLDLSHIGSVVDPQLGLDNGRQVARACVDAGTRMMISAEGSDRTDLVLDLYDKLATEFGATVGITLQARLRRTPRDLDRVLQRPGTIRLVKGAFLESDDVAHRRHSTDLRDQFLALSHTVLDAHHPLAIATHDADLVHTLISTHGARLRHESVEFEMLLGLGTDLLDRLHLDGFTTREYVIFGGEWWLYVLNRLAGQPERLFTAIGDLHAVTAALHPAR